MGKHEDAPIQLQKGLEVFIVVRLRAGDTSFNNLGVVYRKKSSSSEEFLPVFAKANTVKRILVNEYCVGRPPFGAGALHAWS